MSSVGLDVVTFGEALLLLVADRPGPIAQAESFIKRTAGAETNVAIGLARLGLRVGWASRLGDDSMAHHLRRTIEGEGVDCSRVLRDPDHGTGLQFKAPQADGSDPLVESHRRHTAASFFGPQDIDVPWLTSARHLHMTGIFPALSASCHATAQRCLDLMRAHARTVSFDPNLRPGLWASTAQMRTSVNALACQADWVLPGIEEGRLLTGAETPAGIARFYRDRGASLVVVKLGPGGAYYCSEQGSGTVAGFPVARVVDSVGAGDGFAVGVVSALLEGRGLVEAVRRGAWIGARAVQVPGDTEGLPTRAELAAHEANGNRDHERLPADARTRQRR